MRPASQLCAKVSLIAPSRRPGDRQALPGVLDVLKSGKTNFQIGDNTNLFDWTYVDNVVHAHLVAAERLDATVPFEALATRITPVEKDLPRRILPTSTYRPPSLYDLEKKIDPSFENTSEPDAPLLAARNRFDQFYPTEEMVDQGDLRVAGQAFFITNGEPIPFWDFPRAVWAEYNGHVPSFVVPLPVSVGLTFASIGEGIGFITRKTPNLTRGKVVYSTANRYYNIEKVRVLIRQRITCADFGMLLTGPSCSRIRACRWSARRNQASRRMV